MKILWVKSDFLHPATKGGQIRTLEILKRLHPRHEIHYAALDLGGQKGGVEHSWEYCSRAYPIPHCAPPRSSPAFWRQAVNGLFDSVPLAVSRYRSDALKRLVDHLLRTERFDAAVCDFLNAAPNIPDLGSVILFQHNVEALIWKRHVEHAANPLHKYYLRGQYQRMVRYESDVCRAVNRIIAVSGEDARRMQTEYGVAHVDWAPTGVDLDYFCPRATSEPVTDFVFTGSMDWMPNADAVRWFVTEVLPLIRKRHPACSLAIVGRRPHNEIQKLAQRDARIRVTGTVHDIRPYLWSSAVSIVPLRIGGGTRLKIFEAMAAKIPVVSTSIGAEGLDVRHGENILIADSPQDFADACSALLDDSAARLRLSTAAWEMVSCRCSWDVVSSVFEQLLFPVNCLLKFAK